MSSTSLTELKLPDVSLLDDLTSEMILQCGKSGSKHYISDDINCSGSSDFCFENKNNTFNEIESHSGKDMQNNMKLNVNHTNVLEKNFDIGDIEDIFAESSPEVIEFKRVEDDDKDQNSSNPIETLEFFGLDSIEDIFADYDENSENKKYSQATIPDSRNVCNENNDSSATQPSSPSILPGRQRVELTSPILCSQVRKYQLSTNKVQSENHSAVYKKSPKAVDRIVTPNYISNDCNKSMFTVTQLIEMINSASASKCNDITVQAELSKSKDYENERSSSPIIMTQTEKRKLISISDGTSQINETKSKNVKSIIILDSDSESNDKTQEYSIDDAFIDVKGDDEKKKIDSSQTTNKRKLSIDDNEGSTLSPYFSKKQKFNDNIDKPLTLRENVLVALTSKEINNIKINTSNNTYSAFHIPSPLPQKENQNPRMLQSKTTDYNGDDGKDKQNGTIEMLQKFRRYFNHNKSIDFNDQSKIETNDKMQITFSDGGDDFVGDMNDSVLSARMDNNVTNHKVRKKKKNVFLDEEAELSDDGLDGSGDELTDESVGSIVDFICDDNVTIDETDIHAHYLRSVRSPVNGVFKIPQLPNMCKNVEVFSQYVEEDAYEMDSFCVDSHVGLTQVNEENELDLAESLLNEHRKKTKVIQSEKIVDNGDSPVFRRRRAKRQISSDSDDSS